MLRTSFARLGLALALTHCGGTSPAKDSDADGSSASGAEGGSRGGGQDGASTDGTVDDARLADSPAADDAATDSAFADGRSADAAIGADAATDAAIGADAATDADGGTCRSGPYLGTFTGNYASHLTGAGISIPLTGDVTMTLVQEGSAGTTCVLDGESKDCGDLFALQSATVTGVASETKAGDASYALFPFFCTMSGALDCDARELRDGWIQCTYCIGPLSDAGGCSLLGGGGTTGVGGRFAGPPRPATTSAHPPSSWVCGTPPRPSPGTTAALPARTAARYRRISPTPASTWAPTTTEGAARGAPLTRREPSRSRAPGARYSHFALHAFVTAFFAQAS